MTETYNPIKNISAFKNDLFIRIPEPFLNEVIILAGDTGSLVIDRDAARPVTTREIRSGRFRNQIRIDTSEHEIGFSFKSISLNRINYFDIKVVAVCSVKNALEVYRANISNVRALVQPIIESKINKVSASYPMEYVDALQNDLNNSYSDILGIYSGIAVSEIRATVDLDKDYKAHLAQLQAIDKAAERKNKEIENARFLEGTGVSEKTALFAEVLNGERNLSDVLRRTKEIEDSEFDEKIRKIKEIQNLYHELREDGFLSEEQASQRVISIINSVTLPAANRNFSEPLQLQNENAKEDDPHNPYHVIDE